MNSSWRFKYHFFSQLRHSHLSKDTSSKKAHLFKDVFVHEYLLVSHPEELLFLFLLLYFFVLHLLFQHLCQILS